MDSLLQMSRDRSDMMHLFIEDQVRRIDNAEIDRLMRSEMFSIENLEAYNYETQADTEQMRRLGEYQVRQQEYNRELQGLEQVKDLPDGAIDYYVKLIEAEQNTMNMRLMKAAVLGREDVAKRVRVESLAKIISYRQAILEHYDRQQEQELQEQELQEQELRRQVLKEHQQRELERETAEYGRAMDELNLDMLTTAALGRIKTERGGTEDVKELIREFLSTDFPEQTLKAEYVIENLDTCLHNVELIRRMEKLSIERRGNTDLEPYIFVERKLEAVKEYINVVESVLWEYGMTIDYEALQVRTINERDEDFAARRQAYQRNGALRFSLGARRYRHIGEDAGLTQGGQQITPVQTSIEAKLSALEEALGIQGYGDDMRILSHTRIVGRSGYARPGAVIKASGEEAQGRMEDVLIKSRILTVYQRMGEKIARDYPEGRDIFQTLAPILEGYVCTNRTAFENRSDMEKREAAAFAALKEALFLMQQKEENLCGGYAAILLDLITEESNGYLPEPHDAVPIVEDSHITLGTKKKPMFSIMRTYDDCTGMPLFTHRPNIKDIEQGGLGDCYLLAGLVSLVEQNAEEIMNIMRDNGDGTVTVRFMQGEPDGSGNLSYTPYYVRVRKTVPVFKLVKSSSFSRGAFWVKMMEKAYVASGLHILDQTNREREEKGEARRTARELGSSIVRGEQRVDYGDIEGGMTGSFLSLLLGKKGEEHYLDENKADAAADRLARMLPPISEPEWDLAPTRRYGNDSVDSIVYEYIKQLSEPMADAFLHLRKPAADDPDHDALMETYTAQKGNLRFAVRSCLLQLDIIATIAREKGTDILKLDSKEKIEAWYARLMTMFVHFRSNIDSGNTSLSDEDKIIAGVKENYYGDKMEPYFAGITPELFQSTLDILKQRHLALLPQNQHAGQGAGDEHPGRLQRGYYTVKDYRLYERINKALRSGSYISFGTRKFSGHRTGLNEESEEGGMVGEHAYTVINTCSKIIGGEERLFLIIMNPWAEKGVVYDVGVDGLRERAVRGKRQGEKEEGLFPLELKRFAEIVTHWDEVSA